MARSGFTLLESIISMSLLSIGTSVFVLSAALHRDHVQRLHDEIIADGIANQLLLEIVSKRDEPSLQASVARNQLKTVLDYDGYREFPLDYHGMPLGTSFRNGTTRPEMTHLSTATIKNWVIEADIASVDPANPTILLPNGQKSQAKLVTVRVWRSNRGSLISQVKQVIYDATP